MIPRRRRRELLRAARTFATRLAFALMALMVIVGTVRAGSRLYFCEVMATVSLRPCCAASHEAAGDTQFVSPTEDHCCKAQSIGVLPPASLRAVPTMQVAPLLAILPSPVQEHRVSVALGATAARRDPTGPPIPRSRAERERLMVFLI